MLLRPRRVWHDATDIIPLPRSLARIRYQLLFTSKLRSTYRKQMLTVRSSSSALQWAKYGAWWILICFDRWNQRTKIYNDGYNLEVAYGIGVTQKSRQPSFFQSSRMIQSTHGGSFQTFFRIAFPSVRLRTSPLGRWRRSSRDWRRQSRCDKSEAPKPSPRHRQCRLERWSNGALPLIEQSLKTHSNLNILFLGTEYLSGQIAYERKRSSLKQLQGSTSHQRVGR